MGSADLGFAAWELSFFLSGDLAVVSGIPRLQ